MIVKKEFIDNDPCILIRGILFLYGMTKVNFRVSSNQFNVEGFNDALYRFVSALYFFYTKLFVNRIQLNLAQDSKHKLYSEIKSAISPRNQPLPVSFSESNPSERKGITFQTVILTDEDGKRQKWAYFKPCVYEDGRDAVLKIAYNYNIEVHRSLSCTTNNWI